jgi:hypothetical protein
MSVLSAFEEFMMKRGQALTVHPELVYRSTAQKHSGQASLDRSGNVTFTPVFIHECCAIAITPSTEVNTAKIVNPIKTQESHHERRHKTSRHP